MNTVKSFIFMGTKSCSLNMTDKFMITLKSWTLEKQQLPFKYFVGILSSWIALPTIYMKFNVQLINMISQYDILARV